MSGIERSDPSHVLGVEAMDAEHLHLEQLLQGLSRGKDSYVTKPEILAQLKELVDATEAHFRHEEAYMEALDFPSFKGHRVVHMRLMHALRRLEHEYASDPEPELSGHFLDFLEIWLHRHITEDDKQYADHAAELERLEGLDAA